VCFCFVLAALVLPSSAQAALKAPTLIETNPASPSTSLAPRVIGRVDSSTSSAFPWVSLNKVGVVTSAVNPANIVSLYTSAGCGDPPVAQGAVGLLESTGIQVSVDPDSTTVFYATQTEGAETSACSIENLAYRHATDLPEPPKEEPPAGNPPEPSPSPGGGGSSGGGASSPGSTPSPGAADRPSAGASAHPGRPDLRTVPGGRANDNSPLVTGDAPGAASVKVFASADCSGTPIAKGPAAQFATGLPVQVADNSTTALSGLSVGSGDAQSACSDPVHYVEDSTAPQTRITLGPAAKTRNRSPVFRFADSTDDTPGTQFLCRLDRGAWKPCRTPFRLRKLRLRSYILRIKAVDPAGNEERGGAKRRFKVIAHP
jgi:hypothetical protein